MDLPYLPLKLAPEAKELLMAFALWCDAHMTLVESDDWTLEQLVDMFILEAGDD